MRPPLKGMSLREAVDQAVSLGCTVERERRGGEILFSHFLKPGMCRTSASRKDAPSSLVSWLRRVDELMQGFKAYLDSLPGPASSPATSASTLSAEARSGVQMEPPPDGDVEDRNA